MATSSANLIYPYPFSLNVGNFVSIKLSQFNFLLWKTKIMGLIESQDMMGFITGECTVPNKYITVLVTEGVARTKEIDNPQYLAWRRSERLLRGWIIDTLSEEVLGLVVGLDTSHDVWTVLLNHFARGTQDREFFLLQQLQLLRKGTSSLSDCIRNFKNICDNLAAIGRPIDDQRKVFYFVKGLGQGYESFVTTMLKPPIPSYSDLVPLLQSHETMKELHNAQDLNHNIAFVGERSKENRFPQKKGNQRSDRSFNQGNRGFSSRGHGFTQTSHPHSSNTVSAPSPSTSPSGNSGQTRQRTG